MTQSILTGSAWQVFQAVLDTLTKDDPTFGQTSLEQAIEDINTELAAEGYAYTLPTPKSVKWDIPEFLTVDPHDCPLVVIANELSDTYSEPWGQTTMGVASVRVPVYSYLTTERTSALEVGEVLARVEKAWDQVMIAALRAPHTIPPPERRAAFPPIVQSLIVGILPSLQQTPAPSSHWPAKLPRIVQPITLAWHPWVQGSPPVPGSG